jgi:hypothetical protein
VRTLALVTLVALSACDRGGEPEGEAREPDIAEVASGEATPAGGLVKIILQPETDPPGSAAPIELLLEIHPPAAHDGWVEPLAGLVHEALGRCGDHDPIVDIELRVAGGEVQRGEGDGALAACLVEALVGARLDPLGAEPRAIRLRAGDHTP